MLSNDIGERLMIRFKKSKDFNKTILKLQQEGYSIIQTHIKRKRYIKVLKDNKELLYMVYEDLEDFRDMKEYDWWKEDEYKQNIIAIYY